MASLNNQYFSFFLILLVVFSLHSQARESIFFGKITHQQSNKDVIFTEKSLTKAPTPATSSKPVLSHASSLSSPSPFESLSTSPTPSQAPTKGEIIQDGNAYGLYDSKAPSQVPNTTKKMPTTNTSEEKELLDQDDGDDFFGEGETHKTGDSKTFYSGKYGSKRYTNYNDGFEGGSNSNDNVYYPSYNFNYKVNEEGYAYRTGNPKIFFKDKYGIQGYSYDNDNVKNEPRDIYNTIYPMTSHNNDNNDVKGNSNYYDNGYQSGKRRGFRSYEGNNHNENYRDEFDIMEECKRQQDSLNYVP